MTKLKEEGHAPPDAPESGILTFAPDKETLKALQRQQQTAGVPENSSLLTPPGEGEYFKGEGLMETV